MKKKVSCVVTLLCAVLAPVHAGAGKLEVKVVDHSAEPLQGAVVTVAPSSKRQSPVEREADNVVIDQHGRQFRPWVVGIRTGSTVTFANHDDITHHVYSFSDSRQFSFRLQKTETRAPMRFDQPGTVVIGCNIHDWMVGYIRITGSPYVAVTNDRGTVEFDGVKNGSWRVAVWHPGMESGDDGPKGNVSMAGDTKREMTLRVEARLSIKRPPEPVEGMGY